MPDRIDDTVSWLSEDDLDLVLMYFDDPDETLHSNGIGDPKSVARLKLVDENIGYLFERLREAGIADQTDVLIVSDHGHINQDMQKNIAVYDYINASDVDFIICDYGPVFQLKPVEGKEEEIYRILKTAHPSLHVYYKDEFPERLHYANNPRNLPIIGFVDPGWNLHTVLNIDNNIAADHGYDNKWMVMKSSFYAQGPSFKAGYLSDPIHSVDVYNLMCDILNLPPAPNNGTRAHYEDMISGAPSTSLSTIVAAFAAKTLWDVWIVI